MHRCTRSLLVVALAVAVSACQLRLATDVEVATDGSGRLVLSVAMDDELYTSLTADGFEPFAGLADPPAGWDVTTFDEGRGIDVATTFAEPSGLAARVADLQAGLDVDDPLLLDGVRLRVDGDGAATLTGRAGLRPPSSTGLDGPGIAFDGDALEAVLEERGGELVRYDLRVRFPGEITDSDADEVDGRAAVWHLPVTDLRSVRAEAAAPASGRAWLLAGGAAVAAAVLAFGLVRWRRRRSGGRP